MKIAPINSVEMSINSNNIRVNRLQEFLSLIKIGIVYSNLFTTFTGTWLALYFTNRSFLGNIDLVLFSLFGAGCVIAGSCSLNNFIDRDIDPLMIRTKERPTVTGTFQLKHVLIVSFLLMGVGLFLLSMASIVAALFGLMGIVIYVVIYTLWAKRKTVHNTVIGSFSGALPPVIGWVAIDQQFHVVALGLFLLMFAWQPPHFYALAIRRKEEYQLAGVPMLPVVKGIAITKASIFGWVLLLLPITFLLRDLGIAMMVVLGLLVTGWIFVVIKGYRSMDSVQWAKNNFLYSLVFLTASFAAMIVVTFVDSIS